MDKRLQELMELNDAVDIVCANCDKENAKRRAIIQENYEDKWNGMWDDIKRDIFPVVEKLNLSTISLDYTYKYIRTAHYCANDFHSIKFVKLGNNVTGTPAVYLDYDGGHSEISKDSFREWFLCTPHQKKARVMGLLDDWDRLYDTILDDLAKKMEEQIKKKLKDKEEETRELMIKCNEEV